MSEIRVKVIAGARQDAVVGWQDDVLRIRVRARPEHGKANEAVCRLLAEAAGVPARAVSITRGLTSREKVVRIEGVDDGELRQRLGLTPTQSQSGIIKES
jgi:uncharacterized protein